MSSTNEIELNDETIRKLEELSDLKDRPIKPGVEMMTLLRSQPPLLKRPSFTYAIPAGKAKRSDPSGFYPGEYGIEEIGMAEDTDSFVMQANLKKLALSMKAGWNLVGKNKDLIEYIKIRFAQIEVAQGQTMRAFISEVMSNLVRYHNCFIIKSRNIKASGGKIRVFNSRKIKPVAGYFVASPETMTMRLDSANRVTEYKHSMPDGRWKIFSKDDVIHIHAYRKTHFLVGTPAWTPVLDDIRALRRIEEHIENLVYQHIYPLFQYVVGTKEAPMKRFQDGLTEVDIIKTKIQNMPTDGMLVTPERHEIKAIGSESRAIRAEPYLDHFKKRVITGSGLSGIDFGEGDTANRSTADTMSKLAIDSVKFYQEILSDAFNFYIIRELLLESTFDKISFLDDNKVTLRFNEIDLEAQIKKQNHIALLYQMNIITETEARNEMGFEGLTDEERDQRYVHLVEKEKTGAVNALRSDQQPENQFGQSQGPSERKSFRDRAAADHYRALSSDLKRLRNSDILSLSYVSQLFLSTGGLIKRSFTPAITRSLIMGARSAGLAFNDRTHTLLEQYERNILLDFEQDVDRLIREASSRTVAHLSARLSGALPVDSLEYRIRFIEETLLQKAEVAGRLASYKSHRVERLVIKSVPGGEDFDLWNGTVIDINNISLDSLPPFHPNCKCTIEPENNDE